MGSSLGASSLSKSPNTGIYSKSGKSHGKGGNASTWVGDLGFTTADVNRRDRRGRTILHIIAADTAEDTVLFLRALLDYAGHLVNPNLQDLESGYTALHRALYAGNIRVAIILLKERQDLDIRLKDLEGLTPFDLYNGTVEGTNPLAWEESEQGASDLFVWGNNRNYVLGLPNADERSYPEKLMLKASEDKVFSGAHSKYRNTRLKQIAMGRLHTVIATDEPIDNVKACGFGSGGRLGFTASTQFSFRTVPSLSGNAVVHLAVGQDHTIAVTKNGDVFTFGLNKFNQLGYQIEDMASTQKDGEAIQTSPKRVIAGIKREFVVGCAAGRCSSVIWTANDIFTWGTNHGHLGYDMVATPVQITPRKVSAITAPVVSVAVSEFAMTVVLKHSHDVLYFVGNTYFRLNFPFTHAAGQMARARRAHIVKVTCGGSTANALFAALSNQGDVYTWSSPDSLPMGEVKAPKLQRVWALRKKFTAVKDVAVGLDGSIILCTESGHVFVRMRPTDSARATLAGASTANRLHKFVRISYLQRIVRVFANETGGFAALKMASTPDPIAIIGRTLGQDFRNSLGHLPVPVKSPALQINGNGLPPNIDEDELLGFSSDLSQASALIVLAEEWTDTLIAPLPSQVILISKDGKKIIADKCILAARSPTLAAVLTGESDSASLRYESKRNRLYFLKTSTLALLILLDYLYSDNLVRIWVPVMAADLREAFMMPKWVKSESLYIEMKFLAMDLAMPHMAKSLESSYASPLQLSLADDMAQVFKNIRDERTTDPDKIPPVTHHSDAIIELEDCKIAVHVFVLTSRCPFFAAMYGNEGEWIAHRRASQNGLVVINLKHLRWEVMEHVLQYIYCDTGVDAFDCIDKPTEDDYNDFVLEILAAANELLLDKLKLICQAVLRNHVHLNNISAMLQDAFALEAGPLKQACLSFCAVNMETVLEGHLLDELPDEMSQALACHVISKQSNRHPYSRQNLCFKEAAQYHQHYLQDPDIAVPSDAFLRRWRDLPPRSPIMNATGSSSSGRRKMAGGQGRYLAPSPGPSPDLKALTDGDLMFSFDDEVQLPNCIVSSNTAKEGMVTHDVGNAAEPKSMSDGTRVPWGSHAKLKAKDHPSLPNLRDILAIETQVKGRRSTSAYTTPPPEEAESKGTDAVEATTSLSKLSQRDRKRLQHGPSSMSRPHDPSSEALVQETGTPAIVAQPSASPWTTTPFKSPRPSEHNAVGTPPAYPKTPVLGRTVSTSAPGKSGAPQNVAASSQIASSQASSQVITPARQSKEKGSRKANESPWAWANVAPHSESPISQIATRAKNELAPGAQHFSPSPISRSQTDELQSISPSVKEGKVGQSFADIQAQQKYQLDFVRGKVGRKTLAEIQAEETLKLAHEKENQQAEDFARWWDAATKEIQSEGIPNKADRGGRGGGRSSSSRGGGGGGGGGRHRGRARGG